jgi:chromosome partitioning protein
MEMEETRMAAETEGIAMAAESEEKSAEMSGETFWESAGVSTEEEEMEREEEREESAPDYARIVAIANQKGGVGKSTTAINLGAYLAMEGQRVLVVDLDPQSNATSGLGASTISSDRQIYDVLVNEVPLKDTIVETSTEGLDLAPSSLRLAGAEVELVSLYSREGRLKKSLEPVRENYDIILVDCPPSLGLLTVNALAAADEVMIPIQCEYYALEGLVLLLRTIEKIRVYLNPDLRIGGILLTMHDTRTNISKQVMEEVRKQYPNETFITVIPRNVRLSEAPSYGQPISQYDPLSRGALAYQNLAKEVISHG